MRSRAAAGLLAAVLAGPALGQAPELRGSWQAQVYRLRDGTSHSVDGLIVFTQSDWLVVFLVKDGKGAARRGSGEGGSYTLSGDRLLLRHRYNVSGGATLPGLPASPLRLVSRGAQSATEEPCRAEASGDTLTLHFPSGNSMAFRRSSGP